MDSWSRFAHRWAHDGYPMSDDTIYLVPYDEKWTDIAAKEIASIRALLPEVDFEIEHIGSTAIPGLSAKPIIDLLIGIDSLTVAKQFIEPLEKIGYSYWRENPKGWHFYFVKGLPLVGGTGRTHHVHIYEKGHDEFHKRLLFRDYLKAHPEIAKAYSALKSNLADMYTNDREKYTDAKTDFIMEVVASAELADIVLQIQCAEPPTDMTTKIIAIDGGGGAGKSTLADGLSKRLGACSIIHTDDFASWDQSQNWYPRMLEQALAPLQKNQVAKFQKYDWNKKALGEWITIEPQEFVILEGVSSARKEFRPYLAFSIYVETDRELRLRRGLERDGLQSETQWLKWMKEEDEYLARDNPKDYANVVVSGEGWMGQSL